LITYPDDVTSLLHRLLYIEGEACINFGRDFAGDNLQDLLAELDQKSIESGFDLLVNVFALSTVQRNLQP